MSDDDEIEMCSVCGEPVGDDGGLRMVDTQKRVAADGAELPGNPLDLEWRPFCAIHLAEFDAANDEQ